MESAFQSSRVYGQAGEIGPFPEYLFLPGRDAKKLVKERAQGLHSYQYRFDGMTFYAPDYFISLFYNFLYLNALCEEENAEVAERLLRGGYTAFSDLATSSLNCQARSAAIFVALSRNRLTEQVRDFDSYLALFRTTKAGKAVGTESYTNVQLLGAKGAVSLLSPIVPLTVSKEETEQIYAQRCGGLTNKKTPDNYLD